MGILHILMLVLIGIFVLQIIVFTFMWAIVCIDPKVKPARTFRSWFITVRELFKMSPAMIGNFITGLPDRLKLAKYRARVKWFVFIGRELFYPCDVEMVKAYMLKSKDELVADCVHMTILLDAYHTQFGEKLMNAIYTEIPVVKKVNPKQKFGIVGKKIVRK